MPCTPAPSPSWTPGLRSNLNYLHLLIVWISRNLLPFLVKKIFKKLIMDVPRILCQVGLLSLSLVRSSLKVIVDTFSLCNYFKNVLYVINQTWTSQFVLFCWVNSKAERLLPLFYKGLVNLCNGKVVNRTTTTSVPKLLSSVCEWIRDS